MQLKLYYMSHNNNAAIIIGYVIFIFKNNYCALTLSICKLDFDPSHQNYKLFPVPVLQTSSNTMAGMQSTIMVIIITCKLTQIRIYHEVLFLKCLSLPINTKNSIQSYVYSQQHISIEKIYKMMPTNVCNLEDIKTWNTLTITFSC